MRIIAMEFFGNGDPFFGGGADDRVLLTDGTFGHTYCGSGKVAAEFETKEAALEAGARASNRRAGGLLSALGHNR